MNQKVSKCSFHQISMHFQKAFSTLEPQDYVVVEQLGAKVIPLDIGRLVELPTCVTTGLIFFEMPFLTTLRLLHGKQHLHKA